MPKLDITHAKNSQFQIALTCLLLTTIIVDIWKVRTYITVLSDLDKYLNYRHL